jgi:HSP20 family protein
MKLMPWRNKKRESREVSVPSLWDNGGLDRLFERWLREPWAFDWPARSGDPSSFGDWIPPVDITESEREVTVRTEIPGVDPENLSITVSGDVLTLAGEKSDSAEKKGENYYRTERRFGSFRRSIQLPTAVDADKVNAEYQDGVLTVTMERKERAAAKRIAVSVKK